MPAVGFAVQEVDFLDLIREKTGCGLGFELAPILPGLMWLHRRRRRTRN
jgi:hypothetical protein